MLEPPAGLPPFQSPAVEERTPASAVRPLHPVSREREAQHIAAILELLDVG